MSPERSPATIGISVPRSSRMERISMVAIRWRSETSTLRRPCENICSKATSVNARMPNATRTSISVKPRWRLPVGDVATLVVAAFLAARTQRVEVILAMLARHPIGRVVQQVGQWLAVLQMESIPGIDLCRPLHQRLQRLDMRECHIDKS